MGTDDTKSPSAPTTADASGYGLTMTLLGGVLLALAYYGVLAIDGAGDVGGAIPGPFYGLVIALLFVLELLQRGTLDAIGLGRALAVTAVYGGLFVLAAEGGVYLWERPEAALDGFVGVTVLAVSLVVAGVLYVASLTVFE